jgi:hypothetical protein
MAASGGSCLLRVAAPNSSMSAALGRLHIGLGDSAQANDGQAFDPEGKLNPIDPEAALPS